MEEMDRDVHGRNRPSGVESHHHYYGGWGWCWPGSATWCGAFIIAIGAGMILAELEMFEDSEPVVWGIVLAAFGLYTMVRGPREDSWRGPGR